MCIINRLLSVPARIVFCLTTTLRLWPDPVHRCRRALEDKGRRRAAGRVRAPGSTLVVLREGVQGPRTLFGASDRSASAEAMHAVLIESAAAGPSQP